MIGTAGDPCFSMSHGDFPRHGRGRRSGVPLALGRAGRSSIPHPRNHSIWVRAGMLQRLRTGTARSPRLQGTLRLPSLHHLLFRVIRGERWLPVHSTTLIGFSASRPKHVGCSKGDEPRAWPSAEVLPYLLTGRSSERRVSIPSSPPVGLRQNDTSDR